MLEALHYLHGQNIVHRNIVPEAMAFDKHDFLKLGGFLEAVNQMEVHPGARKGPLDYMSPEVPSFKPYTRIKPLITRKTLTS